MRHYFVNFIIFISILSITNLVKASSFQKTFEDLKKTFEQKIEKEFVDQEQSLITDIQNVNFLSAGEELEDGVFMVHIPAREDFSDVEVKMFPDEKLLASYREIFSKNGSATGFRYKDYIITNYHACRGRDVLLRDYNDKLLYAKVLAYNLLQDICVLSINNTSQYQDFAEKKIELKNRELANTSKRTNMKKANVFSIRGNFEITNIAKDNVEDVYSKSNAYLADNFNYKCLPGTSGSPVVDSNGLRGIIWGAASDETQLSKESKCFFLDRAEIDKIIVKIEKTQ